VFKKLLIPEDGATVKWYQYPFALGYGLWQLLVTKRSVD